MRNRSYIYILPLLRIPKHTIDPDNSIENTYLYHNKYPNLNKHIFVKYHEGKVPLYVSNRSSELKPEGNLYTFRIEDKYLNSKINYEKSKYSLMSLEAKSIILRFHELEIDSPISGILFRKESAYENLEKILSVPEANSFVYINREAEIGNYVDINLETYYHYG